MVAVSGILNPSFDSTQDLTKALFYSTGQNTWGGIGFSKCIYCIPIEAHKDEHFRNG